MERKPEWKTKEERIQDTPTIPTLSDQKKPPFPAERKAHPKTTRKKEEQTFSLLPKGESLPSPSGNDFSLSLLLKKANCRSPKRPPSLLPKAVHHFPY